MAEVNERTIRTNGVDLHVVEAGTGTPVVLAHGFPELAYSWRHQIPALADAGYRVIAPDQRGYGRSSRPEPIEDYDIDHLTGDLLGLLDELGEERAIFVGHDWGSMVVSNLALLAPERVPRRRGHERAVPPARADAAGADDAQRVRRRVLLHRLLPGARRGRRRPRRRSRADDAPAARRPCRRRRTPTPDPASVRQRRPRLRRPAARARRAA